MEILSHYSKYPGKVFCTDCPTPPDNDHKPGGLWLSDDSEYGWPELVHGLVSSGSSGWEDGNELLQHRYDFIIDPAQLDQILVLSTPDDLQSFTTAYGEASYRGCLVNGEPGYGLHIEWHRIKSDYKGILITPYQRELSHRNGTPKFHWYRFDCASGCIWDITCLKLFAGGPYRNL